MNAFTFRDCADRVRELLDAEQIGQAIDELKTIRHDLPPAFDDEITLHARFFNSLQRNRRKMLITAETYEVQKAQLVDGLLELLREIPRALDRGATQVPNPASPVPLPNSAPPVQTEAAAGVGVLRFESILGINNLKDISWIGRGLVAARSVCRVLTPSSVGTGFLVAPRLVMTNNHVIPDARTAEHTFIEFNYEEDGSGQLLETVRYALEPVTFRTSPRDALDYTLVGVAADTAKPPLESWGVLRLNPHADPVPSEHVVIIQHPNGGLKRITLTANYVTGTQVPRLHYTTDTMPGSSGSPVFNDQWQVIAIHHAGGKLQVDAGGGTRYVNEGILMSAIRPDASVLWPNA
jgi:V8-like Glu-specific endopeptidase